MKSIKNITEEVVSELNSHTFQPNGIKEDHLKKGQIVKIDSTDPDDKYQGKKGKIVISNRNGYVVEFPDGQRASYSDDEVVAEQKINENHLDVGQSVKICSSDLNHERNDQVGKIVDVKNGSYSVEFDDGEILDFNDNEVEITQ